MSYWELPPQHGAVSKRELKEPDGPQVQSLVYNHAVVNPGSNVWGWCHINRIDVYETVGEHVAGYDKAYRWGSAPVWGRCIEVTDWNGNGPAWGLEVDVVSTGNHPSAIRRGVGVVLGRTPNEAAVVRFHAAYDIVPHQWDSQSVFCETAYNISVPCRYALSMPGGAGIKLSEDPAVPVYRFDPATGYVGLWKDRLCVQGVHAVTGAPVSMVQF